MGVRDPTLVSTDRVVARQLLPDVSFDSGGSAPIRQVHSDSQLSAGLDALICVPKPAAQAGESARQFERCLGAPQHGDGFPECPKRLFSGLGQCPATSRNTESDWDLEELSKTNFLADQGSAAYRIRCEVRNDTGQRSPRQHGRVRIAEVAHNILYSADIFQRRINIFAVQAQSPAGR